ADEIDEALDDIIIDEVEIAEKLTRKKYGKYDLSDETISNKAYLFLKHRGYDRSIIEEVFRRLLQD
ncbi:MAG: regulatory protein RecX, partial [Clostridiales bacterium]|nr:regulatory protein RecX [Clostridiales bacterium]